MDRRESLQCDKRHSRASAGVLMRTGEGTTHRTESYSRSATYQMVLALLFTVWMNEEAEAD